MGNEQPEPDLPLQQRRAEPAHGIDLAVDQQHAGRPGRGVRPGAVEARAGSPSRAPLRFDVARSWFPAQQEGPSGFLPTPISIPETRGVDSYKDVTPRVGVAYDVFGNGRTAVRMSIGSTSKALACRAIMRTRIRRFGCRRRPRLRHCRCHPRLDRCERNFVPDCNLMNPAAQDLRASGGDVCGVLSKTNFGQNVLTNNFDPAILHGWGVRPSDWNLGPVDSAADRIPIVRRVAYSRRWFRGFSVVDNRGHSAIGPDAVHSRRAADLRLPAAGLRRQDSMMWSLPRPGRSTTSSSIPANMDLVIRTSRVSTRQSTSGRATASR